MKKEKDEVRVYITQGSAQEIWKELHMEGLEEKVLTALYNKEPISISEYTSQADLLIIKAPINIIKAYKETIKILIFSDRNILNSDSDINALYYTEIIFVEREE